MCCKNIVVQVLVVACVVSLAAGNPQFFPISNLRQYLEHKRQTALRDSAIEQQKTGRGTTTGPREVYLEPSRPVTGHPAYRVPSQPSSASNHPVDNLQHPYESTVLPKLSLKPHIPTQTEHTPVDRVGLTTKDVRPQFPDPEFDVTSRPAYPKKYSSYQPPPPRREKPVYVGADGVTKVKLLKKPSGYNPEVPPYMTQSHSHYPFQFTKHAEIPDQHRPSHEFPVQAPSDVLRRQQHPEEKLLQSSKHGPPAAPSSGVQTSRPPRAQTWNPNSQAASNQNPQIHDLVANTYGDRRVRQSAAETGFSPTFSGGGDLSGSPSSSGDRVEFQIHGQEGPHSYRFGFDTGKGHNRQFRYEERDSEGLVKGRYGFYDKTGKLQVVNYSAHPHHGFQADGNFGKYPN